jgi:hypothetical protein
MPLAGLAGLNGEAGPREKLDMAFMTRNTGHGQGANGILLISRNRALVIDCKAGCAIIRCTFVSFCMSNGVSDA